jgi:hypothetical protein
MLSIPQRTAFARIFGDREIDFIQSFEALFRKVNNPGTQATPTAKTAAGTLTIAELQTKIITGTHATGSNINLQLPTGENTDAGLMFVNDDSFDWTLINLSAAAADTVTITANTGHTVVGVMVVQSAHATTGGLYGNAATFRTRKTATNTYSTYRIA